MRITFRAVVILWVIFGAAVIVALLIGSQIYSPAAVSFARLLGSPIGKIQTGKHCWRDICLNKTTMAELETALKTSYPDVIDVQEGLRNGYSTLTFQVETLTSKGKISWNGVFIGELVTVPYEESQVRDMTFTPLDDTLMLGNVITQLGAPVYMISCDSFAPTTGKHILFGYAYFEGGYEVRLGGLTNSDGLLGKPDLTVRGISYLDVEFDRSIHRWHGFAANVLWCPQD